MAVHLPTSCATVEYGVVKVIIAANIGSKKFLLIS